MNRGNGHAPEAQEAPEAPSGVLKANDLGAEEAVLSAVLFRHSLVGLDELFPHHFNASANKHIFHAARELDAVGRPIDVVSVAGYLRDKGLLRQVGGSPYLAQLSDATPAVAHVEAHALRVREKWLERASIAELQRAAVESRGDVGDRRAWLRDLAQRLTARADGFDPATDPRKTAWRELEAAAIFAPLEPVSYIIEPLDLCAGAPALVAGYGFSGKTVALQAAAVAIASGQRVWGTFAARQGRVLHIDYEQGARLTSERYQRLAAGMMVTPDELAGRLKLVSLPQVFLDSNAERFLCEKAAGFDLAIVDSLRAAGPSLEENDSAVRGLLDGLNRVSERTGCCFVVVHHARKPSQNATGGAKMAIRGSGAIFDACSSVLILEAEKGQTTRVTHEKARASGVCAEDFSLRIEDQEIDGNPRGGLVVLAEQRREPSSEAPAAAFRAAMERVLTELAKGPAATKSALAARVKGRRNDVLAAIDQLVSDGQIRVVGKRHEIANPA